LCLRNPCENTFSFKLQIFVFLRGNSKYVRVLAVYNTLKYFFIFFIEKTQASQLIAIKDNKTQPGYWLKPVTGSTTVACICMLQWQGN
jgi:hypothetical protein